MGTTNRALSFAIVATIFSLLLLGCAGTVATSEGLGQTQDTSIGPVLVAPDGRTLYTYDKDDKGASNCSGLCTEQICGHARYLSACSGAARATLIDSIGAAMRRA